MIEDTSNKHSGESDHGLLPNIKFQNHSKKMIMEQLTSQNKEVFQTELQEKQQKML